MRYPRMSFLTAAVTVLSTLAVYAALDDPLYKLLPNDPTAGDKFGGRVGISGIRIIVGADGDDDNGSNSGSAYILDATTGLQLFKLLPTDPAADDEFGASVAISGTRAIIGAPNDNANGDFSGSAYIFDTTTGLQLFKLLPTDGVEFHEFGKSVAIDGTKAIVGAQNDGENGIEAGAAYLFDTTTGLQIAKLLADDGVESDVFGGSVAISGTRAIVGAHFRGDNGPFSGAAYVFDTSTGLQIAKLLPVDGAENDRFGGAVAISGTTAIVGVEVTAIMEASPALLISSM